MEEKIQMLRSKLPSFLVEQRKVYGILSRGIHELSEQECLDNFPVVRNAIEIILDERIYQKELKDKTDLTRRLLTPKASS